MRGYYSVYDYENMKFGFAPHSTSLKSAPVMGKIPETPFLNKINKTIYPVNFSAKERNKKLKKMIGLILLLFVIVQ